MSYKKNALNVKIEAKVPHYLSDGSGINLKFLIFRQRSLH